MLTSVPSLAIANNLLVNMFRTPRPVGHQHCTLLSPSIKFKKTTHDLVTLLNPTSPPQGWPACPKDIPDGCAHWLVGSDPPACCCSTLPNAARQLMRWARLAAAPPNHNWSNLLVPAHHHHHTQALPPAALKKSEVSPLGNQTTFAQNLLPAFKVEKATC